MEAHLRGAACKVNATRREMRARGWTLVPEGDSLGDHRRAVAALDRAGVPHECAPARQYYRDTVAEEFWAPEWACIVLHVARKLIGVSEPNPSEVAKLLEIVMADEDLRGAIMAATELSDDGEAVKALLGMPCEGRRRRTR